MSLPNDFRALLFELSETGASNLFRSRTNILASRDGFRLSRIAIIYPTRGPVDWYSQDIKYSNTHTI